MSRNVILLGPLPPPYGGVAIFTNALFEFTKAAGVRLIHQRRLHLFPELIKYAFRARIVDSYYSLVEYPNIVMVPIWLILKLFLRFEWVKVVHDGSLPSRYHRFNPIQKMLFRLSIDAVAEFVVVNDNINTFLTREIGVRQRVRTINALLPLPDSETHAALNHEIEAVLDRYEGRVVSTGVFIPSYGFLQAALAVERVRLDTGRNIGLILIDGAFAFDEQYKREVLDGRPWIAVLEQIPHPQVLEIFRRSDVFLRAFKHEGYGLSRIEAVWCGTPVIAARGEESRGILIYDFDDLERLVAHLHTALFNPARQELRDWGQVFQHEADANLNRWKEILGVAG
jgi:glycogen synthase